MANLVLSRKSNTKNTTALMEAVLKLKTTDEAKRFFRDLLTEYELAEFANRWKVAQMLDEGISYTKIQEATGMSSTTVARVSKWLNDGMDGYKLMINRSRHSHHHNATRTRSGLS